MMEHGWFKMDRAIFEDKLLTRDAEYLAVWCFLCANAAFQPRSAVFAGKPLTLQPGQLITGRKAIAAATGVNESKVERVLNKLESGQRIEQQKCTKNRLISVLAQNTLQKSAQQTEQQPNNNCTTSEQQMNTIKNDKKDRMKYVNNSAPARRNRGNEKEEKWKRGQESVYSSDASYDLDAWAKTSMERLMNYKPKHAETSAKDVG